MKLKQVLGLILMLPVIVLSLAVAATPIYASIKEGSWEIAIATYGILGVIVLGSFGFGLYLRGGE